MTLFFFSEHVAQLPPDPLHAQLRRTNFVEPLAGFSIRSKP
jgi:hypothetical protein